MMLILCISYTNNMHNMQLNTFITFESQVVTTCTKVALKVHVNIVLLFIENKLLIKYFY